MSKELFNKAKSFIGKPEYETNGLAVYNMDCIAGMKSLPKSIINLTVTSPPYNIGKEYENLVGVEDYISWCIDWLDEVYKLTISSGAFWLNLGYFKVPSKGLAVPIPYLLWDKTPFYFLQEIVWNYSAGVACKKRLSPRNEKFLWYVKDKNKYTFNLDSIRDPNVKYPNQKKNGKLKCNPLGKNPSDVWQIAKVTSGKNRSSIERTAHPAQFPTELIERIIKVSSNEGDLILDPFMGSGSTAECALRLKRYVIGFELNLDYIKITQNRIDKYLKEKKLKEAQIELSFGV